MKSINDLFKRIEPKHLKHEHINNYDQELEIHYENLGFPRDNWEIFLEYEDYHPQLLGVQSRIFNYHPNCVDNILLHYHEKRIKCDLFDWAYYFCTNQERLYYFIETKTIILLSLTNLNEDPFLREYTLDILLAIYFGSVQLKDYNLKSFLINKMIRKIIGFGYLCELGGKIAICCSLMNDEVAKKNISRYFLSSIVQLLHLQMQRTIYFRLEILENFYKENFLTAREVLEILKMNGNFFVAEHLRILNVISENRDHSVLDQIAVEINKNHLRLKDLFQNKITLGIVDNLMRIQAKLNFKYTLNHFIMMDNGIVYGEDMEFFKVFADHFMRNSIDEEIAIRIIYSSLIRVNCDSQLLRVKSFMTSLRLRISDESVLAKLNYYNLGKF